MSLHNHTHQSPHFQLTSICGWAAGPKASFSYLVNWETSRAKRAYKTIILSYLGTHKNAKESCTFEKLLGNI